MPGMELASLTKERILSSMNSKGPSLPIHIAKALNLSPLFASAFLSELYGERKIKISNMKVGSSPLYYIPGQELQLENFVDYLNSKEKEAFLLLKQNKLLEDSKQLPAIRVALRAIKDFAIPVTVKINNEDNLFWKHFQLSDSDMNSILNKSNPEKIEEKIEEIKEKPLILKTTQEEIKEKINEESENSEEVEEPKKQKKKTKEEDLVFSNKLKEYFSSKDIEVLEIISEKKKEAIFKIRAETPFGKQEYYLIAKDKKKISEDEITIALQKAREARMIALIMAPGEIDKKALDYIKTWRNLIKFDRIKF